MKLLREPRAFNLHTSRHIMRLMGRSDDKWRKYLLLSIQHSALSPAGMVQSSDARTASV
jgi:hypothetical protein